MLRLYIVSEDEATKAIIKRIVNFCCGDKWELIAEYPVRGGQIKNDTAKYNKLSNTYPVILLTDLDNESCAPALKAQLFNGAEMAQDFIFNVAIDEAEAWLMADRENFAKYFKVPIDKIPESALLKQGGRKELRETEYRYKSSMYMQKEIMAHSSSKEFVQQFKLSNDFGKSKEYNTALIPFVQDSWQIEVAAQNSDSLQRMINRIKELQNRKSDERKN